MSVVHLTWRCLFTRLALGELDASFGDKNNFSALVISSSTNGSVATLSGLVQLPLFGAEKAELPQDEVDESENEEQTDSERWNAGRLLSRLSLISAHSCAGLAVGVKTSRDAGVLGGVTRRWKTGNGANRPSDDGVGWNSGLDISETASDISIVGMTECTSWRSGVSSS